MTPSVSNRLPYEMFGALSQLVEAASAMTELEVKDEVKKGAIVSDDDETSRKSIMKPSEEVEKEEMEKAPTTGTIEDTIATEDIATTPKKEIFPQKLMEILSDESVSHIVSWLPHGQSFVIANPSLFCQQVLPKYSVSTKYPSFTRKLNRWGFRQAVRGSDTGAFHHPFFRRDQPSLCAKMVCQKSRDRNGAQKQQSSLPPKKRSIPDLPLPPTVGTLSSDFIPSSFGPITASTNESLSPASGSKTNLATSSLLSPEKSLEKGTKDKSESIDSLLTNTNASVLPVAGASILTSQVKQQQQFSSNRDIVMPFISNDAQFVADTLRRREVLEVARAAKAMLYESYIDALNLHKQTGK